MSMHAVSIRLGRLAMVMAVVGLVMSIGAQAQGQGQRGARGQAPAPAPAGGGQRGAAPAAPAAAAPVDFSQVQIKTTKVADNFYTLEGQGGMIGVLTGPDGVFMVDTQFAPVTDKLVAA